MGVARAAGGPALLIGDIDLGGVFASLQYPADARELIQSDRESPGYTPTSIAFTVGGTPGPLLPH
jgi:hypothetical protein